MATSLRDSAAAAVRALQQWYGTDSYASSTGLYHWDDPNLANDVGGSVNAGLINLYGYTDAVQDTFRWWNSANAITALIDYMLITKTNTYLQVVEETFGRAQNAYTINEGTVTASAVGGAVAGFAGGAAVGAEVGGPVGAVVGGVLGGLAGFLAEEG